MEFHEGGIKPVVPLQPIDAQCFGVVAFQGGEQFLAQLAAGIQRIAQLRPRPSGSARLNSRNAALPMRVGCGRKTTDRYSSLTISRSPAILRR